MEKRREVDGNLLGNGNGKFENWMDMVKLVGEVSTVWRTFRCVYTCLH